MVISGSPVLYGRAERPDFGVNLHYSSGHLRPVTSSCQVVVTRIIPSSRLLRESQYHLLPGPPVSGYHCIRLSMFVFGGL